jgi:hypothetical protein
MGWTCTTLKLWTKVLTHVEKKSLDLFGHDMFSLHVYIHLWGWEKRGGLVQL